MQNTIHMSWVFNQVFVACMLVIKSSNISWRIGFHLWLPLIIRLGLQYMTSRLWIEQECQTCFKRQKTINLDDIINFVNCGAVLVALFVLLTQFMPCPITIMMILHVFGLRNRFCYLHNNCNNYGFCIVVIPTQAQSR